MSNATATATMKTATAAKKTATMKTATATMKTATAAKKTATAAKKTATMKTATATAAKKTATATATKYDAKTQQQNIVKALLARAELVRVESEGKGFKECPSIKWSTEAKIFGQEHMLRSLEKFEIDLSYYCNNLHNMTKAKSNFIAIYAMQKVRKAIESLAHNSEKGFDSYSRSILRNLASLQALSNDATQACLNDEQARNMRAKGVNVTAHVSVASSTASTQASSTREMLRMMGICNIAKGKHDDNMTFTDTPAAKRTREIFANQA